jgi:hypothetical protein
VRSFPALRVHHLVGAIVLFSSVAAVAPTVAAAATNPTVVEFAHNKPQPVHGDNTYGTVASVPLTAGNWLVLAKAELDFPELADPEETTTCGLTIAGGVGTWQGLGLASPPNSDSSAAGTPNPLGVSMTVSVGDHLAGQGAALLRCTSQAGANHDFIRQIRITAIKVAKLTVTELSQSTPVTVVYGTGAPEAVWGWSEDVMTMTPPNSYSTGVLPISAGNWWSTVNASFASVSGAANGQCDFLIGKPDAKFTYTTSQHGHPGDRQQIASQVAGHLSNPYGALFGCTASNGTVQVQQVYIAALRFGQLQVQNPQSLLTFGHGTPLGVAMQANADHPIVAGPPSKVARSLSLKAGSWLVHGTVTVGDLYHVAAVHCVLKVGSTLVDSADTQLSLSAQTSNFEERMVFDAQVTLATPAKATVLCGTSDTTGQASEAELELFGLLRNG